MVSLLNRLLRATTAVLLPSGLLVVSNPANAVNQFDVCTIRLLRRGIPEEQAAISCAQALEPTQLSECVLRIGGQTSVAAEDALKACFRDRRPVDLAECVVNIQEDALQPYLARLSSINAPTEDAGEAIAPAPVLEAPPNNEAIAPEAPPVPVLEDAPNNEAIAPEAPPVPVLEDAPNDEAIAPEAAPQVAPDTLEPITLLALDTCRRSLLPERHSECVIALSRDIPDLSPATAMETCINAETYPPELFPQIPLEP